MPERIQLRRTKGWRLPPGAISCARPTRMGNPVHVGVEVQVCCDSDEGVIACMVIPATPAVAVAIYRALWESRLEYMPPMERTGDAKHDAWVDMNEAEDREYVDGWRAQLERLRGRDLACWCPLDQPCHVDVLLDLANR